MYQTLKLVHIGLVGISISLFVYRGWLMLRQSKRLSSRLLLTVPHIVDTALLASGISLIVILANVPLTQTWLQFKLAMIFAYIVAGSVALKYGRTYRARVTAFLLALVLLAIIVLTATNH